MIIYSQSRLAKIAKTKTGRGTDQYRYWSLHRRTTPVKFWEIERMRLTVEALGQLLGGTRTLENRFHTDEVLSAILGPDEPDTKRKHDVATTVHSLSNLWWFRVYWQSPVPSSD